MCPPEVVKLWSLRRAESISNHLKDFPDDGINYKVHRHSGFGVKAGSSREWPTPDSSEISCCMLLHWPSPAGCLPSNAFDGEAVVHVRNLILRLVSLYLLLPE